MTPQDYMDLPYSGMAEKELRKHRRWQLTPQEKIEDALGDLEVAIDMAQNAAYDLENQWRLIE